MILQNLIQIRKHRHRQNERLPMADTPEILSRFPRAQLLSGPTPMEPLERLSAHLGINLWIKRDDLSGLGMGGNKIRQLEFYFGAALAQNADTVLITGAVQSNYVRSAAAAAAKLGLKAILQLEDRVPGMGPAYATSGNVFLGQLLGAEYMAYPEGEDEVGADKALRDRAESLRAEGKTPYVIPLGLNNPPLGALGYVSAAHEILQQDEDFDAVVVASGSGLTHAGLLAGLRAFGSKAPVYGICVRRDAEQQQARIATVAHNLETLLQSDGLVAPSDIQVWDGALAPGYGRVGPKSAAALSLMARMEGIFLDPVYTSRTFAGVIGLVDEGKIEPGMRVLFVHTGGQPALFAYQDEIEAAAASTAS
jgi:D-cysteine desulfhydrase family pyridoxal phosphate-dependent enzyme